MATLVSDSFNRANGAIGTADVGGAWTALSGSFSIVSNVASAAGDGAVTVLGVTATDVEVSITYQSMGALSGDFEGVIARCTNLSNFYLAQASGTGVIQLYKCVSGSFTQLGSSTSAGAITAGQTFSISCNGTAIKALVNGTPVISVTDSALTTSTYCGMRSGGGNTKTFENFLVDGLSSGSQYSASGTVAGSSSGSGAAAMRAVAAGTVAAVTAITGAATGIYPATGTDVATTATQGAATALYPASGTVAATSGGSGSAGTPSDASGTVAGSTGVTGSAGLRAGATGVVTATTGANAAATVRYVVAGTVTAVSGVRGSAVVPQVAVDTPPARTLTVAADNRALSVLPETRVLQVVTETRTLGVGQ